jgi:hypothetical protein
LPTWKEWRARFLKESGITASVRTGQRRLKAFKELLGGVPKKVKNNPGAMDATERYRLRSALLAANDLVAALSGGWNPSEALARFRAYTTDSHSLRDVLAKCPKPKDIEIFVDEDDASFGAGFEPGVTPLNSRPTSSSTCELDFRPGKEELLAEYISVEHFEQFDAVFGTLPPAEKQAAFLDFALTLAKTFVGFDDNGAESAIADYLDDMQTNFTGDILISDVVAKADEISDGILVAYNRK